MRQESRLQINGRWAEKDQNGRLVARASTRWCGVRPAQFRNLGPGAERALRGEAGYGPGRVSSGTESEAKG
ncbi:hypothetical protein chiPu_0028896 [Chiloscyllium punctatum]|uniref:Uncharacterized protein n=1 Tax=Chiloscyllium punctatum TaxID=137246 RepID=A0A401TQG2_CHIPU|nr:hypothetical protein [Chiloscyllium punctatum]